jgi:hypothetical protein
LHYRGVVQSRQTARFRTNAFGFLTRSSPYFLFVRFEIAEIKTMSEEAKILLSSDNGVTLSKVMLTHGKARPSSVSSYVVESPRTPRRKTFATRTDALDYYEEEIERCRLLAGGNESVLMR